MTTVTNTGSTNKNRTYLSTDNLATLSGEKPRDTSKISECLKKRRTCIAVHLDILCLICINHHRSQNYAEFDSKARRFNSIFIPSRQSRYYIDESILLSETTERHQHSRTDRPRQLPCSCPDFAGKGGKLRGQSIFRVGAYSSP